MLGGEKNYSPAKPVNSATVLEAKVEPVLQISDEL
jgi:hypothetical protein